MLDYMKGLEMLPERVRWVGKPAMGEGISGQEVAELVMNARLGYASENRQEGAGGKRQESNQQKGDGGMPEKPAREQDQRGFR